MPSKQAVFGYGRSLGATKYYDLHVGYSRMFQGIYDSGTKYGSIAEQLGILNANAGGAAPGLSTTNITGMTGLGDGAGSLQKVNNNWEIDQAFSWVRNRHELKFGFDYMSRRFAFHSPGAPSGQFTSAAFIPVSASPTFSSDGRSTRATTRPSFSACSASITAGLSRITGVSARAVREHRPAQRLDHRMEGAAQSAGGLRAR